jgi:hypothetical protein
VNRQDQLDVLERAAEGGAFTGLGFSEAAEKAFGIVGRPVNKEGARIEGMLFAPNPCGVRARGAFVDATGRVKRFVLVSEDLVR